MATVPSIDPTRPVVPALPVFTVIVPWLGVAGDDSDDVPLVPPLTEINGDPELGSTLTPAFAFPEVPLAAPFGVVP